VSTLIADEQQAGCLCPMPYATCDMQHAVERPGPIYAPAICCQAARIGQNKLQSNRQITKTSDAYIYIYENE